MKCWISHNDKVNLVIALNDVLHELYRDFVLMKGVDHLLTLLQHQNIDIVSKVIGFIGELCEADNYIESDNAIIFIIKFIKLNGVQILLENLKRLNDPNIMYVYDYIMNGVQGYYFTKLYT